MNAKQKYSSITVIFIPLFLSVLFVDWVFPASLNVASIDPVVIQRPVEYVFSSESPLYVKDASLTISGGVVTSVSATVYNNGHPRHAYVYVYLYDDSGKQVGSGHVHRNFPSGVKTVPISISQAPQYTIVSRIEVRIEVTS